MKAWDDARRQFDSIAQHIGPPQPLGSLPTRSAISKRYYEGLVAVGLGDLERARGYFEEAANGLEAHRRLLHTEALRRSPSGQITTQDIYSDQACVLADLGNWDEAFTVAEQARARVLAEVLGEAEAAQRLLRADTTFRRYKGLTAVIERLTSQLAQARKAAPPDPRHVQAIMNERSKAIEELTVCETELFQAHPHWQELVAPQTKMLSLKKVATLLPTGTLLLAYLFSRERLLIWAVTDAGLVSQCSIAEFDGKPFRARQFATRTWEWVQQLDDGQSGVALVQVLLQPFDTLIEQAKHLLIVPYAELNMFPFQALPWRGQPLGLQKVLSYLPAASLLQYIRSSNPVATGALVVGDPDDMWQPSDDGDDNEGYPLPPLPAARVEAQTVAAIYGVRPFIGSQATKEIIQDKIANNPKIIHLATHGYFQSNTPLTSGIALAHRTALSVDEVIGLNIKADVVVLSACETGRGKLQGSELVGLTRSLIYAGTRSAIVTLWRANDLATAILMQSLHRRLYKDVLVGVALQQAIDNLYHTTVQQALDFCTVTLANFPRQSKADQAAYATLMRYMGDVLAVGGDYARAIATYQQAITAFGAIDYTNEVNELEGICSQWALLASDEDVLQPERRVFNHPSYWAAFEVIGDWR